MSKAKKRRSGPSKTISLGVRIETGLYNALKALARGDERNLSGYIRRVLDAHVKHVTLKPESTPAVV